MDHQIDWTKLSGQKIYEKLETMKEYKHLLTPKFKSSRKEIKLKIISEFEKSFDLQLKNLVSGN
jgi:hypothetical protein